MIDTILVLTALVTSTGNAPVKPHNGFVSVSRENIVKPSSKVAMSIPEEVKVKIPTSLIYREEN